MRPLARWLRERIEYAWLTLLGRERPYDPDKEGRKLARYGQYGDAQAALLLLLAVLAVAWCS